MSKLKHIAVALAAVSFSAAYAGNPDRVGQAGATELLINSWARSSGWGGVNTASVKGIESHNTNVAGLAFTPTTEIMASRTSWLVPSGIYISNIGLAQRVSDNGVLGIGLVSLNFGDIEITTVDQPQGGLGTYKPQFINLGISYAHIFSDHITGGVVFRAVSEQVVNVKASGFALDAGIQYMTSSKPSVDTAGRRNLKRNDIKFGITLKNIGPDMQFSGDGLSVKGNISEAFASTVNTRASRFNLPSLLTIGGAYDFKLDKNPEKYDNRLTLAATFFSHTFQRNQLGVGLEYGFKEQFFVRTGYVYEKDIMDKETRTNAVTGFSAGAGVDIPFGKEKETILGLDYSYRTTSPFQGIHSIGLRLALGNNRQVL